MSPILLATCAALGMALLVVWRLWRTAGQVRYIREYVFPRGLYDKLGKRRPELDAKQFQLVTRGLRQFFLAYHRGGRQFVAMPSQIADELWHEFILHTRNYDAFCRAAFGGFLHHTPAVALGDDRQNNSGLRRRWWHSCLEENIDPRKPTRLPLLFALDAKLAIADGFRYQADCTRMRDANASAIHCGGDFGSTGFDGGTDGLGDGGASDGASGCGGGGCGGGGD